MLNVIYDITFLVFVGSIVFYFVGLVCPPVHRAFIAVYTYLRIIKTPEEYRQEALLIDELAEGYRRGSNV